MRARGKLHEIEGPGDNVRVLPDREDPSGSPLGPQQGQIPRKAAIVDTPPGHADVLFRLSRGRAGAIEP